MRRHSGLAATLALLLGLTGCGGVGGGGGGGGTGGSGRLSTLGFSLSDEIATSRVDAFKQAHPEISVEITEGGFDEQQFLSAVADGNPPDLVYLDRKLIGSYATRGAVTPLTDCVREHGIDVDQYRPVAREQVTLDGVLYGIPEFYSVRVVYLDEAVLRQAGVTPDQVDLANWAGLPALTDRLARVSNGRLSRIGIDPKIPEFLPLWAKANGADLLSADGRTARLDDPKVLEALQTTYGLLQRQAGWDRFKGFRDTFDFFGADSPLARHQIGVWPMEDWFLNQVAKNTPDAQLVVKPFVDRQGNPLTLVSGQSWAIPKGAKNPEAACEFAKQMTATETWVAAAKARVTARQASGAPFTGLYTGNAEADRRIMSEIYRPSGNPRFDNAVQTILSVQEHAFTIPASRAGAEFDKTWMDAVNRVLSGQSEPAEALRRAQSEATAALDRAAK
ncbi:sugar ABC transporter substrate-binding protein [Plantactinospora sp. BC1]|uniref:extracellular solute-binding protein n=1 Tax=Plantactinospora sp. BC1 TaxID=2108470 RepID=UPI000D163E61|nr:extracellular solute-binding protein [Plantactinospora sp. BC1]AVT29352.1 sugar ABC transporter substrate-binding protein [Plantactinospora sp. BC1]